MKALTSSSYEYMKLMVVELQRQLDEIEGCKDKTPENTPIVTPKAPPRRQNPFNKLALEAPGNMQTAFTEITNQSEKVFVLIEMAFSKFREY